MVWRRGRQYTWPGLSKLQGGLDGGSPTDAIGFGRLEVHWAKPASCFLARFELHDDSRVIPSDRGTLDNPLKKRALHQTFSHLHPLRLYQPSLRASPSVVQKCHRGTLVRTLMLATVFVVVKIY
jgi:hypothetical protein